MKTKQSKQCGFWKGRLGNGCDDVNEDDWLYRPLLDCAALHWTALGSTGLNWIGLGPGGPSVPSVPGGPGGQGDPVVQVGQVIYMIRLVWVIRVVGFSGWSRWSRWSAWSETGGGTKTDEFSKRPSTPHNGRTVAPEAILFESPCRAHSETQIAQIIWQGRDIDQLFYYS